MRPFYIIYVLLGHLIVCESKICDLPPECYVIKSIDSVDQLKKIYTRIECNLPGKNTPISKETSKCEEVKDRGVMDIYLDSNPKIIVDNSSISSIIGFLNNLNLRHKTLMINNIKGLNIESEIQVRIKRDFVMKFTIMPHLMIH